MRLAGPPAIDLQPVWDIARPIEISAGVQKSAVRFIQLLTRPTTLWSAFRWV